MVPAGQDPETDHHGEAIRTLERSMIQLAEYFGGKFGLHSLKSIRKTCKLVALLFFKVTDLFLLEKINRSGMTPKCINNSYIFEQ